MPYDKVFSKYGKGALHSGSKSGPVVKDLAQAVAIYLSEKAAAETKPEYRARALKERHRKLMKKHSK